MDKFLRLFIGIIIIPILGILVFSLMNLFLVNIFNSGEGFMNLQQSPIWLIWIGIIITFIIWYFSEYPAW